MSAQPSFSVTVQEESLSAVRNEIEPLLMAHWREIAHYQDIALDPDWAAYQHLEDSGTLRIYTMRLAARLIGYAVFIVRHNIHYQASLQAVQDILYLDPAYRKGRLGVKLIRLSEQWLRDEGVQAVYHHIKCVTGHGPLFERLGYTRVDEIYAKRLDQE